MTHQTKQLKRWLVAGCLAGMLAMTANAFAVKMPRSLATDLRIKRVAFQRDNVVPVKASTFTTTQIVFGHDEAIEAIQNGDLDAWTVSVDKALPNMLFLKPTMTDSNTNMTVVTNKYTYYFHLISGQRVTADKSTYAIEFTYPEERRAALLANMEFNKAQHASLLNAQKDPKHYHWDYNFSGDKSIMPLHIFDDGQFTYMQLRPGQAVPAVFAVDNRSGKESVVNYRREGQYLVVQQIAPQFTLREGNDHVASVFNNQLTRQLKQRG